MPSNEPLVLIKAAFENDTPNQYWKTFVLTIRNYSDQDIQDPVIGVKNPLADRGVSLAKNSGTTDLVLDGDTVTFHLESYLRPLKARSERQVTLAYNHPQGGFDLDTLPAEFTVDGRDAVPPDEKNPPSIPQNLRVVSASSNRLSVAWDASTDDTGIDYYLVHFMKVGDSQYTPVNTPVPSVTLSQLQANSEYEFFVRAVDVAGNTSQSSIVFQARTTEPLPDMGDWTVRRAPFVDYTAWPTPQVAAYSEQSDGLDGYFLGFLVAIGGGDRKVYWGGNKVPVDSNIGDGGTEFPGDATQSDYGKEDIARFRAKGGKVILSFGGASGVPVEEEETNVETLVNTYDAIINNYQVTHLDFDFEGGFISNKEALDRHIQAIIGVRLKHPELQVSYTLPADGQPGVLEGFNSDGVAFINALAEAGVEPSLFNGMLMEFGERSPTDLFEACRIGLEGMHQQIKTAFPHWSDAKVWRRMGACPMFGKNNNRKVFTLENQRQLVTYALEKGLGCLAGWDATRDANQGALPECDNLEGSDMYKCTYVRQSPFDFAKIINTFQPEARMPGEAEAQEGNLPLPLT
ncbi:fibronectin type III domain-containing protein [Archangium sp.]|uniref:fibronectin type III domain-containing protein n=1 Tax=Archangium sp. TaxID=1872627 RepID=UPI002D2C738F|nr:fibronectin type III domain-containing protein [Archangium sp.]HYO51485.1 fibronectin type III domain-containing protein [Archangium sp.]